MKSVYSAVRTGSLNKAICASSLKGSSIWCLQFWGSFYTFKYLFTSDLCSTYKAFCFVGQSKW